MLIEVASVGWTLDDLDMRREEVSRCPPPQPPIPVFRAEAVRLAQRSGKSNPVIANGRPPGSIGVSDRALRARVRVTKIDASLHHGLTNDECEGLREFCRENRIRNEERDIM